MPLVNGRAEERVSRGQASERAVCVYAAVSVAMGACRRRPPTRFRKEAAAADVASPGDNGESLSLVVSRGPKWCLIVFLV